MAPSSPPSVALVLPNLDLGGAERQAVELALHLSEQGWRPVVLVAEMGGPQEARLREAEIPIYDLKAEFWRGKLCPRFWINLVQVIRRIRSICREEQAMVLQSFLFWQNVVAAPAGWLAGARVVTGRRNLGVYKDRRPHYQLIENFGNLFTDAVVCNSRAVAEDVLSRERFVRRKISIIRNAVDIQRFAEAIPEVIPQLEEATFVIGTIGNLKRQKRHDIFLEAVARARDIIPGLKAFIAGRDLGEEEGLQQLRSDLGLEKDVLFLGAVDDVAPLYKAMDAFILTSDWEGLPNVIMEAMAAKCAIISTNAAGVSELVKNGKHGLIVERGDAAEIAAAIVNLFRDAVLRERLAAEAQRRARRLYTPAKLALKYARVYNRLAREGTRR